MTDEEIAQLAQELTPEEKTRLIRIPERICTSHVERQNLNIRTSMRRYTRLSITFSKKWENLKAALALYFAYYNFCRVHSTIRCTPAMAAGITKTIWKFEDLLRG